MGGGEGTMHMMRRIKSIASGRSSVSDPVSFFFVGISGVGNAKIGAFLGHPIGCLESRLFFRSG